MPKKQQTRNRYTPEQQQEDRSVNQFRERMTEFGWLADRAERDIGEDLTVRIVTNSQPVGVPFYAQLKSVTNLTKRRIRSHLSYRLEVADLLRWEDSSIPVVVFVWDVNLREGRWQTVKSLVHHLDQKNSKWREQQTTTVYLPWANTTDDAGLHSLKSEVGHLLYPLIAGNRTLELNLTVALPDSDEATADRIQLDRHIREGTPVTIAGRYIQQLEFPDWWEEWFAIQGTEIARIRMQPRPHPDPEPVSIILLSAAHHAVHLPNIELRLMCSGTDRVVFSNELENKAVTFSLVIPRGSSAHMQGTFTFHVNHVGYNILETLDIVRFLQGVRAGGKLSVLFQKHGGIPVSMHFDPQPDDGFGGAYLDPRYIDLVEKLCFVQERLGYSIRLPNGDISAEDVRAAYELKEILQDGKTVSRADSLSFKVHDLAMIRQLYELHLDTASGATLMIRQDAAESYLVLFGEKIQVGPMTKTFVGKLDTPVNELKEYIHQNDSKASYTLWLSDIEIAEEYPNWQSKTIL